MNLRWIGYLTAASSVALLHAGTQAPAQKKVSYPNDLFPVIKANCLVCHNEKDAKGYLDLSKPKGVLEMVVPGKPAESELIKRLKGIGGAQMPLGFRPIPDDIIAKFETWIKEGASTEGEVRPHWAYVKPVKPTPPIQSTWIRNPIDAFVLAKLKKEGLKPSPEASKETLIRRVSLDLIGLPPTAADVQAFLADKSPNAYEKVVDRLLASPHYGEHVGRYWLDLARYADTNGYEADRTRTAYLYRDWLFNALNANMPFDKFTREQLAGDLMPNATMASKIATGFHRNSMMNEEGGTDAEEQMYQTIVDRVNTTSTVWLGSTLACSRCHDHKFDPFSKDDYYRMYAYFGNNRYEVVGDVNVGQRRFYEPTLKVTSPEQQKQLEALRVAIKAVDAKMANPAGFTESLAKWLKTPEAEWKVAKPASAESKETTLAIQDDGSVLASGVNPPNSTYRLKVRLDQPVSGFGIRVLPDASFPMKGPGRATSGNFILTKVAVSQGGKSIPLNIASVTYSQGGYSISHTAFGGGPGWAVSPEVGKEHTAAYGFEKTISGEIEIVMEFNDPTWKQHGIGKFAILTTDHPIPAVLTDDLRLKRGSKPDDPALAAFFRSVWGPTASLVREERRLRNEIAMIESSLPTALVLADTPGQKKAQVRDRGMYKAFTGEIASGTPHFLPASPPPGADRSALAKWLTSRENPLTARVQVNRMWEMHFGRGIVESSEDFGTQSSAPSHPDLLDWLACEFMDRGWDMKAMHRLIVTSATYRQNSASTAALNQRDPRNELLARGPRFRLDAESIRDVALAAAGLLDPKIGGPSAMPYQPAGVWNSPYSGERWMERDKYRRGVYTFWKRTATYPVYSAFDAGTREECVPRRARTNTPLQALALLNDPAMMEAARGLGDIMAKQGLEAGFRRVTSRLPNPAEKQRLLALKATLEKKYKADPAGAKKVGGDAAWTMVANVLLNMDEAITKE